jgi:hypothetical protein
MPDEAYIGIVYCDIAMLWNPDYALDDATLHDDAVDSAMLAVRCNEAGRCGFLYFVYQQY